MKLRIARKMDLGGWKRRKRDDRGNAKRPWWTVYNGDQLARAEARLRRSWQTACPPFVDEDGRRCRKITEDFYRMNRVHSRRIRRGSLRREWPERCR